MFTNKEEFTLNMPLYTAVYFASDCKVLRNKIRNPYWLRHIYETYKENTKFKETIVFEVVEDNF